MACIFFYLIFEDFSRDFGQDSLSGAHRGGYMPPLVKQETLAESFYYVSYGSSIIMSKVCQIISVMKA